MTFRYFDDFRLGEKIDLGRYPVTEAEILAFARQYDPQRMHTDRDFAARTSFGGLIASGWHSCAMFMRLQVDGMLKESSALASPGVDGIRWLRPVRAGDVLRAEAEVIDIVPSRRRPDRGLRPQALARDRQSGLEPFITAEGSRASCSKISSALSQPGSSRSFHRSAISASPC